MAEKAAVGTAAPHAGGHAKAFPPLDPGTFAPQLVWLALSFGLLYLILKRAALPRIGEVIEERRGRIRRDLEQAEKLKIDTERALTSYEEALSAARLRANTEAKNLREVLAKEIEAQRTKTEAEIARELAAAEQGIAESKAAALTGLDEVAADVATAIVARLTGTQVSKAEVEKALTMRAAE